MAGRRATLRRASLRLVPVALATWGTAAGLVLVPEVAAWAAGGLWSAALGVLAMAAVRARAAGGGERMPWLARVPAVVLVLAIAGAAAAASHVAVAQPQRTAVARLGLTDGRALEVRADVVGKVERRADGTLAFDAVAMSVATGTRSAQERVEIVVRVDPSDVDELGMLDVGSIVTARGAAREARPGERAVLVLWASQGVQVDRAPQGAAAVFAGLRRSLVGAVDGLPGAGAGLVPGLAVGDTSVVTAELDAAMKTSSLSHLTAVSGANCALVVGLAFAFAALLRAPRAVRVVTGLVALVGFVILVTPEPSVVRAAAMAAIAMLAVMLGRTGAGVAILSLAITVLLVADPWLALSLGFALSVVATASLLTLARPLAAGLSRVLPRALALALAVPLAAQLACGPLLVLVAPQIPVYGVVANLLAGPAAPIGTVLGLAACLTGALPWLQSGLAALAWLPASWIAATATTVTALPLDVLPWMEGWPGLAALTAVGAAVAVIIAVPRSRRGSVRGTVRASSAVLLAVVLGVGGGLGALSSIAGRWTLPADWTVLACDVGQGDAVVLRSGGAVALIDTGPAPEPLAACLSRAGIDRVDLLVLTHFDLDHAGGAAALAGRVGTVLHGPADPEGQGAVDTLRAAGARSIEAAAGMTGRLGAARWRVLWPAAESRAFPPGNDASVVLDVRGGGIPPTLLLGDLSASPQRLIEASGALAPPYGIVKVAHHGSADQDAALYVAAAPAVALFTVGAGNDYGHPRAETLDVLAGVGAHVVRTDQDGIVAAWAAGPSVSVWRERGG